VFSTLVLRLGSFDAAEDAWHDAFIAATEARPARLASVLRVVHLVFNEAHSARAEALSGEAIRQARRLRECLPESEVLGLLELLLHDARRGG